MAVTRLKRRIKKNYIVRELRNRRNKKLLSRPVIKKVTVEELLQGKEK